MGEEQKPINSCNCTSSSTTTTTAEEDDLHRQIIDEIESLCTLSHSIRVFSVKWQVIRKKLEELSSMLVAAETRRPNHHRRPLDDVIVTIFNTIKECRNLASSCINVSYSGKLLMQSDLDKVISKLDSALKNVSAIFSSSGVVTGDLALVVLKPSIGSSREDMRFYVKDLLTRVKIGDTQMKIQALISLNEVIFEDEKYVKIVVEIGDFVILLSNCLDSVECRIQEEASVAIAMISGFESYKGVLLVSGVIGPLIRVVENGSLKAKKFAITSLEKLTENGDNAWALSAHGGVTALLNLCSKDEIDAELIGSCCWVLRNLVGVEEIKRFMIEENAISTCIKLIKGRDEVAQIGAAEFLQSMVSGDETVRQLVVKEGGARALVRIIDPKSNFSFKSRETALRVIENLCFSSVDHVNLLINYGFMDNLLYFLRKGDASIQELAFKSAFRLCGTSEDARKSMGDGGFMVEFVKFLEAKSYEIREMAAEALSIMVLVHKNRKKFASDEHNIGLILQLLDPKQGNSGNFKFLLSILLSISSCNHARRKIANSGYVKNIENLANSGVSDAKKIVRKLSTNRFKSMLNGIWHS
ncbi:Importin subunit alpha-3 [Bienertia sinuspersici]